MTTALACLLNVSTKMTGARSPNHATECPRMTATCIGAVTCCALCCSLIILVQERPQGPGNIDYATETCAMHSARLRIAVLKLPS